LLILNYCIDKLVDLDELAITYVEQIMNADDTIKSANRIKEKANTQLQEMMKDAQYGRVKNYQVAWGTTTRKSKMVSVPLDEPETKRNKTVRIKEIKDNNE
jgi:predicted phage-related endonuclease